VCVCVSVYVQTITFEGNSL